MEAGESVARERPGVTGPDEKTMSTVDGGAKALVDALVSQRVLEWMAGPDTGLSSEAMAFCRLGIKRHGHCDGTEHPLDPADFNRCLLLVEKVPEIREAFSDIAGLSEQWTAIIDHWDELRELFIAEAGWNWSKGRRAPKTYARMKEILAR